MQFSNENLFPYYHFKIFTIVMIIYSKCFSRLKINDDMIICQIDASIIFIVHWKTQHQKS